MIGGKNLGLMFGFDGNDYCLGCKSEIIAF